LFNIDFGDDGLTGKDAEALLESVNIIVNREVVPSDKRKPYISSGIRLGTPTVTTRGMGAEQMEIIGSLIAETLRSDNDEKKLEEIKSQVSDLVFQFLLPD
jgi:glycine hydroxymethyltransferase